MLQFVLNKQFNMFHGRLWNLSNLLNNFNGVFSFFLSFDENTKKYHKKNSKLFHDL